MSNTIVAIATGENIGGISIIRMSGNDSLHIIDKVFRGKSSPLSAQPSHTIHYGHIYKNNKLLDEVLVSIFIAPRSYTTENTVEINCHGGILNTRLILELLIDNGATLAAPGEFTKRAYLNGRIDLSKAEAVIDVINADSKAALNNAIYQLSGSLSSMIKKLREALILNMAQIEAALDDPEHYDLDIIHDELINSFTNIQKDIIHLAKSYDNGRVLQSGIRTVILGKPNVGKSSLINCLSGYDTAIVTDIAGTTRDLIKEKVLIDDLSLNIIDTAGIRNTVNPIEQIGIDKSVQAAKTADLILLVIDSSKPLDEEDFKLFKLIGDKPTLVLLNKTDLDKKIDQATISELTDKQTIELSLKTEKNIDSLKFAIKDIFTKELKNEASGMIITSLRQKDALNSAAYALKNVLTTLNNNISEDLVLVDAMDAYTHLSSIIGETVGEELVNTIFSKFCMGK